MTSTWYATDLKNRHKRGEHKLRHPDCEFCQPAVDQIIQAIEDRVLKGTPSGGFVEHVAKREWEEALNCADRRNRARFTDIMAWRINELPMGCAKYNEPMTESAIAAHEGAAARFVLRA